MNVSIQHARLSNNFFQIYYLFQIRFKGVLRENPIFYRLISLVTWNEKLSRLSSFWENVWFNIRCNLVIPNLIFLFS